MAKHFQRKGRQFLGFNLQGWIRGFFGGNAALSIVILFLICAFLVKEAVMFFPQHHRDLELYRKTGQEYVGHLIKEVDEYTILVSATNQAYYQELDAGYGAQRGVVDSSGGIMGALEDEGDDLIGELEDALDDFEDEPDDPEIAAAYKKAQENWKAFARETIAGLDRKEVDSFGRLEGHDDQWEALKESMVDWDPVEGDPTPFVAKAKAQMAAGMSEFDAARIELGSAGNTLKDLKNKLVAEASQIKKEAVEDMSAAARKAAILEGSKKLATEEERIAAVAEAEKIVIRESFPFAEKTAAFGESFEAHEAAADELKEKLAAAVAKLPSDFKSEPAAELIVGVKERTPDFIEKLDESVEEASQWKWDAPLGFWGSTMKFFFGRDWVTNSSWHDFYGLLPLITGSLLISLIALAVAIPFSIGAAIYVNRLASRYEQTFIKPAIEMIQAIPSVVLGFFGIMVLGEGLRELSQIGALCWVPGFPMQERLNILNAGLLLALMAVPTIFTLCEDALNNVPRSYSEASLALGGSKLQTVTKVVVPTAISGILAAVLLGLGRIIGETMVVLLVAGNKIAIPDFGEGLGVIAQPAHTMTGIIAQEMGEVSAGTLHFRALFLVGLVLFTISLMINVAAQRIIKRLGHA